MTLTEKVAYLKGLAAGLELDKDSKQTKIFEAMFDILEDMALTVSDIDEDLSAVEDLVDAIDEDLDELEEYVFCDEDDDFCGCCQIIAAGRDFSIRMIMDKHQRSTVGKQGLLEYLPGIDAGRVQRSFEKNFITDDSMLHIQIHHQKLLLHA